MGLRPARTTNWAPAALTVLGLVLLGLLPGTAIHWLGLLAARWF